jgi:hypothetical protein
MAAEGAHVRNQLPNLLWAQPIGEGRHASRTPAQDTALDVIETAAVEPFRIHERRANPATPTMPVTTAAVHLSIEPLAFAHRPGIFRVAKEARVIAISSVCRLGVQTAGGRRFTEAALFALTTRD